MISHCSFDLPNVSDVEHLFMCLWDICIPSLEKYLVKSFAQFLICLFCLLVKVYGFGLRVLGFCVRVGVRVLC